MSADATATPSASSAASGSGGVVQAVFSDEPNEDVKVLDFDDANEPDAEASPEQLDREIKLIEREMHQVL